MIIRILLNLGIGCVLLGAQVTVSSVRVYTEPAGASFYVDGQLFAGPATFLWPAGSKHVLNIEPLQYALGRKTRYTFSGWTDSTGTLSVSAPALTVTADPSIAFFRANLQVQHAVSLNFFTCPDPDPGTCGSPGAVYVNGTPYFLDTDIYLAAGSQVKLQAAPNSGFVFLGWLQGLGNTSQAFVNSFVLNAPVTIYPRFGRAVPVTIVTSPPGLQVLADRATAFTPLTLDWGVNTTHTIGAVTPQFDMQGNLWVFDSWSDGGSATHAFTAPPEGQPVTITARYVAGARVTFLTEPPGLKLKIDGRDNWQYYSFSWAPGTTHTISAPLRQEAAGRAFVFRSWSNGGPAIQEITIPEEPSVRLTASYDPRSTTVIRTSPPAIAVLVDGVSCQTPCTIDRAIGEQIQVSAPQSVSVNQGTRLDFRSWTDGAIPQRTITALADSQAFEATYGVRNRLAVSSDPPDGAAWQIAPPSPDGFYDTQTTVSVRVEPLPGYRLVAWEGDASGSARSVMLSMAAPRTIRARLDQIPSIAPAGVQNAAGETPRASLAPGSIASIYGASLAPRFETGPENPLAQTIADVTVHCAGRWLPLFFVSPEQINVQLPSDLEEGLQSLVVRWEGKPEVKADFAVERNAPGLFDVLTHEDGKLVSAENPARTGEVVTAYGTGFGPYGLRVPDGFAAPESPEIALVDPVELWLGDASITPLFVGAAPGRVGVAIIRFRIPDDAASPALLKIRINNRESNTVLLPL